MGECCTGGAAWAGDIYGDYAGARAARRSDRRRGEKRGRGSVTNSDRVAADQRAGAQVGISIAAGLESLKLRTGR